MKKRKQSKQQSHTNSALMHTYASENKFEALILYS